MVIFERIEFGFITVIMNKLAFLFCWIGLYLLSSCSDDESCEDVNLGKISFMDQEGRILRQGNVDTLVYRDLEGTRVDFFTIGSNVSLRVMSIPYQCSDDDTYRTVDFEAEQYQMEVGLGFNDSRFRIIERQWLPLPFGLQASARFTKTQLLNQFADNIQILVFNDENSTLKGSIFTRTNSHKLDLDYINSFNYPSYQHYESISIGGRTYLDVHRVRKEGEEKSEIYFTRKFGLLKFVDRDHGELTLDTIIYEK